MPIAAPLQMHRERWNGIFAAITHIDAPAAEAARVLPDELLFGPCTSAMAECFRLGLRVFAAAPELQDLAERDAGLVMLVSLVARQGPVSVSRLARQFHVSRTHAGNVMQRAEAQGLAISEAGLGSYRASPELMPVLMRFYAVIFLTFLTALKTR